MKSLDSRQWYNDGLSANLFGDKAFIRQNVDDIDPVGALLENRSGVVSCSFSVVNHLSKGVDDGDVFDAVGFGGFFYSDSDFVDAIRPIDGVTSVDTHTVFILTDGQRDPAVINMVARA